MKAKEKKAILSYAKELKELRDQLITKDKEIKGIKLESEEAMQWSNRLQYIIDELYNQANEIYYENKELIEFHGYM